MLGNRVAVVYGAGGPIGGAVAFAREGAAVFLAGTMTAADVDISAGAIVD